MYTKPINRQITSRSTIRFRIKNKTTGLDWPVLFSHEEDAREAIKGLPITFRTPGDAVVVEQAN